MAAAGPVNEAGAALEWTPGGGPIGTLHAVYEDKAGAGVQGDRDVHYRSSVDGGRTWGEPIVLNDDDPSQLFTQLLPTTAVAPSGRLDVAWWDTRHGLEQYATDVYFAYSVDDGRAWSKNVRLTDRSVSRRFGSWVDNFGDTRQPPALASSDALSTVVWDDTRLGDEDAPLQDLYATAVQFAPMAERSAPATLQYAGAGLVGVLAGAGAVILGRRRRLGRAKSDDVSSAA
jgi:hypothetical protein